MPKRALAGTFLTTVALALLLSFKTPDTAGLSAPAPASGAGGASANVGTSANAGTGANAGTSVAKGTYTGQLTGSTVQTPFGNVQVQVTLQNGKITDVQTLQLPSGGHSSQVSRYAAPQLRSEVLQAQSARVDTISGATYTSMAYQQSLQAALDQAA
ncbi:MAG: FMN-binding protein [Candidatus Limnocylindrales bacterium]